MIIKRGDPDVSWLSYATARIESPDGFVVYFDPGRYDVLDDYYTYDGDLILVAHSRHYDSDAVEQIVDTDATVAAFEGVDAATIDRDMVPVEDLPYGTVHVDEEAHLIVDEVDVRSLPAFSDPDGPHLRDGDVVHPQGFGYGFHISIADRTVFRPDDFDVLEDHKHLEVLPFFTNTGGSVVMDHRETADLAETLDPDLVLPIRYGTIPLLETDPDTFVVDVASRGTPVVLDDPNQA